MSRKSKTKVYSLRESKSEINIFPLGDAIFVDLFDDGSNVINLGNGKKFYLLSDANFGPDTFHKNTSMTHKHPGIRPRWGRVIAVNPKSEATVKIGDKILIDTLEWSAPCPVPGRTERKFYRVAVPKILLISDVGFTKEEMDAIKERPVGAGYWIMDAK